MERKNMGLTIKFFIKYTVVKAEYFLTALYLIKALIITCLY